MLAPKDIRRNPIFRKICSEAAKAAVKYDMLHDGDNVLVGISGGEDSLTLMHVLDHLRMRAPFSFQLHAVTVDMSFATFNIKLLEEYCRAQEWDWQCIRLDGAELLKSKNAEERPCALCSRLRRGQIHAVADQLGCNIIALGQQLDDLCASLLMSLFRGGGLKTMGPNVPADAASKRLIRPLCTIRKSMIHQFALLMEYPQIRSCPYEEKLKADGDRAFVENLLTQLDTHFGDVKGAMLTSMSDVRLAHLLDTRYITNQELDKGKL